MVKKYLNEEHPAYGWIILLILAFIWGSSFILMKKGLEAFSPMQVGTLRMVFAFIVLLPFAVIKLKTVFKEQWEKILVLGVIANFLPAVLFPAAEVGLSSSITGVLNSLTPIFTLIVGMILFQTKLKILQVFGLILGFGGTVLLIFVNNEGGFGKFNYYAIYVIVATICYGISANMVKEYFPKLNSVVLTSLQMFSVGPIALIYLLSTDFITVMQTNDAAWSSAGYIFLLGAVGTAFALILFNRLVQLTSAVFGASVTYLIPVFAVLWGLVIGEDLFPLHFLGMALIILGVYIVNRSK